MNIRCPKCRKIFEANAQQESFVNQSSGKNMHLIFVECPCCYVDAPVNPMDLLLTKPSEDKQDEISIECPICVDGIVCYIEDEIDGSFYGCGECGNIWRKKEDLFKDIEKTKKKRNSSFNKNKKG